MVVRLDCFSAPPGLEIPYPDCLVVASGEEQLAVGVENKRAYPIIMSSLDDAYGKRHKEIYKYHVPAFSGIGQ